MEVLGACGRVGVRRRPPPQVQASPIGRMRDLEMIRNRPWNHPFALLSAIPELSGIPQVLLRKNQGSAGRYERWIGGARR